MISDVMFEAVNDIRDYLAKMPDVYPDGAPVTNRIKACVAEMEAIRAVLDSPPVEER